MITTVIMSMITITTMMPLATRKRRKSKRNKSNKITVTQNQWATTSHKTTSQLRHQTTTGPHKTAGVPREPPGTLTDRHSLETVVSAGIVTLVLMRTDLPIKTALTVSKKVSLKCAPVRSTSACGTSVVKVVALQKSVVVANPITRAWTKWPRTSSGRLSRWDRRLSLVINAALVQTRMPVLLLRTLSVHGAVMLWSPTDSLQLRTISVTSRLMPTHQLRSTLMKVAPRHSSGSTLPTSLPVFTLMASITVCSWLLSKLPLDKVSFPDKNSSTILMKYTMQTSFWVYHYFYTFFVLPSIKHVKSSLSFICMWNKSYDKWEWDRVFSS